MRSKGYEHENMNMPVQDAITQWGGAKRLRCMTNAYIVHRPTPYNFAPTGLYWFWHYIYIALTDYAIQYRPYGATRLQTNNPNRVTLPSIAREGYEKQGL